VVATVTIVGLVALGVKALSSGGGTRIDQTGVELAPSTAARIAGPLPAEKTPLAAGGTPHHSLTAARSVARQVPAGRPSNHHRSPRAKCRTNAPGSPAEAISACATRQVCSVSSDTMPRPGKKW